MPFRQSLVDDGALQQEIEAILRNGRTGGEFQRVPREELERAGEKAFQATRAEAGLGDGGGRRSGLRGEWTRLGTRQAARGRCGGRKERRGEVANPARVELRVAE